VTIARGSRRSPWLWKAKRRWAAALVVALFPSWPKTSLAQSGSGAENPASSKDSRVGEARRHFELGVAHFDRSEWHAALAEFLRSRALAPTRANTKNAAICLRKVFRFDESLQLFEALLREFPDLPAADRELAEREIGELLSSVGTVEVRGAPAGSRVSIDGIERGPAPLAAPIRLSAGSHVVRVVREGSLPFEARVDLAGREAKVVVATLPLVVQAGRLRVSERSGRAVDVIVDGTRVGATPWSGALAAGVHGVWLRGEGNLATAPVRVTIELGKDVVLELGVEPLSAEVLVKAKPAGAAISVDGVLASHGFFNGRVSPGTHRIEVTLAGHASFARDLTLEESDRVTLPVVLEPVVAKPIIELELELGVPLGLLWGGGLEEGCSSPCSSSLPAGVFAQAHATYRSPAGIGLGVHVGYLRAFTTLAGRSETVDPQGPALHHGVVDDRLRLAGLMAGADAEYGVGSHFPFVARFTAGALLGAVTDERSGTFVDSAGASYDVSVTQYPRASYFYVGPEVRIGYRANEHFDVTLGAKLLFFAALTQPSWDDGELVYAGETDRGGLFPATSITGELLIFAMPSVALRYAF
jgi:hypothetical protein